MPDGTLIQWGERTSAIDGDSTWGNLRIADGETFTFSQAFTGTPEVFVSPFSDYSSWLISLECNATGVSKMQFARATTFPANISYRWLAVGRWK